MTAPINTTTFNSDAHLGLDVRQNKNPQLGEAQLRFPAFKRGSRRREGTRSSVKALFRLSQITLSPLVRWKRLLTAKSFQVKFADYLNHCVTGGAIDARTVPEFASLKLGQVIVCEKIGQFHYGEGRIGASRCWEYRSAYHRKVRHRVTRQVGIHDRRVWVRSHTRRA